MSFINGALLKTLSALRTSSGDAELSVGEGPLSRTICIRKGELVGGYSNDPEERIGTLVAQAKGLAPELIEAIAQAAAAKGGLLGDALIAEGLLSPTELVQLLERQTTGRFERAFAMRGTVRQLPLGTLRGVVRKPVGGLLVAIFREKLAADVIETLAIFAPGTPYAVQSKDSELGDLGLTPAEARVVRRLSQGESLQQLLSGPQGDQALRVALALTALGVLRPRPM